MSEWLILIIVLYLIYFIMKKSKTITEKPVPKTKAKVEQPIAAVETKATSKKPSPDQKSSQLNIIHTSKRCINACKSAVNLKCLRLELSCGNWSICALAC
jgi:hypothetical protein